MAAFTTITTINEEPAARTNRDGLRFVSTMLSPPPGKDSDNDLVHDHAARV